MSETYPILYSFRRCPYAMRARMAIAMSGQICRLREVVLRDKPAEMLAASPKATVPVVVDTDGTVIEESLDVIDWALGKADPDGWLTPPTGTLQDMRDLIADSDGPFKTALDRYKYSNRYDGADPAEHRNTGLDFLSHLNLRLEHQNHLFGDRVSLADIAIFPFIRQFANTDRAWFDAQPLPHLQRWLAYHLSSDLFASVMPKFKQWASESDEPLFPA